MKLHKSINKSVILALVLVELVIFSACGVMGGEDKIKVCQVTNLGGIKDNASNSITWMGIETAEKSLNIRGQYLKSEDTSDFKKNIDTFINRDCDLIVTIGSDLADATATAANAHPEVKFSIVDYDFEPDNSNVVDQVFNLEEGAFIAGYLAASVTRTGRVGTFGGEQISSVTKVMDGFAHGVAWYNQVKNDNVEVMGWDVETQTGLFTNDFDNEQKSRDFAIQLMDLGTDIIMPVAGKSGIGAASTISGRGNAYMIGVGYDWALANIKYADSTLTSVMEKTNVTTTLLIQEVLNGNFAGGNLVGNLENGGVGLAPYYKLDPMVSDLVRTELKQLQIDIISGVVQMNP